VRVAALYDVHGNLPALEAVLADVGRLGVDAVVAGGDAVLGPFPVETLAALREAGALFLRGNCERELREVGDEQGLWPERTRWARDRLGGAEVEALAGLPTTIALDVGGLGPVLFCHGSPRRDDEILTAVSSERRVAAAVAGITEPTVVGGHTHVRYDRRAAGKRLVNAGSVGLPYEGRPGAFWAVLGPGVELRETTYDVEAAAAAVRATGFPDADELVATLAEPPSPDEATSYFEGLAAGDG
jgi:predicted phosphodiesterase